MKEEKKTLDLLSIATIPLVVTLGNSMLIPVLPLMEKKLHITSFQVSMIITLYSIAAIIFIPITGFLSDRLGRKRIIIPGLFISAGGSLLAGLSAWKWNSYLFILVGRFIQGMGAAGTFPVVIPLVGDLFKRKEQVSKGLGIIETANTFGKVLSPILGSYLASLLWFSPFLATATFCLFSFLLILFFVKSPKKAKEPLELNYFLIKLKGNFKKEGSWLWRIFLTGGFIMFILFGVLFYLSEILESQYGIDGIKKGLIIALPLTALCLASYITGKKVGNKPLFMKKIIVCGMALLTGSLVIIVFYKGIVPLLSILFLSVIGIGISLPCLDALITERFEENDRGMMTSIYMSIRFIGVALGPPLIAFLDNYGHKSVFMVLAGCSLLSFLIFLYFKQPENPEKQTLS